MLDLVSTQQTVSLGIVNGVAACILGLSAGGELDLQRVKPLVRTLRAITVFGVLAAMVVLAAVMVIARYIMSVNNGNALFALLVCVVVAEIGSRIHLDPLVVMLAAGVWLKNFSRADANALLHSFEAAELPVFLVFFSLAGAKLDIGTLAAMAIPVILVAAARATVFFFGCRLACRRTAADQAVTRYGWTGLVPQAGLSLALVVVIQKNFPTFGTPAAVLLLSVVGINQLFAPVLLRLSLIRSGEAGKRNTQAFAH